MQPHGLLLALREPGLRIVQVSANVASVLGVPAELGTRAEGLAGVVAYLDAMRAPL